MRDFRRDRDALNSLVILALTGAWAAAVLGLAYFVMR